MFHFIRKLVYFFGVLSTGLFAGFTSFFAFTFAPTLKDLPAGTFLEFFRYDREAFDNNVLYLYIVMLISTGMWIVLWRKRYRMVDFYLVLGAFLCVVQEILLSFFGHYHINTIFRSFAELRTVGTEVYSLREEWAYFMDFHFATNLLGFCLMLGALKRATSAREISRLNSFSSTKKQNPVSSSRGF